MSRKSAQFDPNNTTPGNISTNTTSKYGLSFLNESNLGIDLQFIDGSVITVPAYYLLSLPVCVIADYFMWSIAYTVPVVGTPNPSLCVVTIYEQNELANMPPSGPLPRLFQIGNNVPLNVSVAANQVTAGTFMAGVLLPASQVAAGTFGAGVLLPAGQVSGTSTNDDPFTGNINQAAGKQVNLGGATGHGASSMFLAGGNVFGSESLLELFANGTNILISAGATQFPAVAQNVYNDGTSDKFIGTGIAYEIAPGQGGGFAGARNSGTSGSAGGTISWTSWFALPVFRASSGSTGAVLWEGSSDPGSNATEGDWWANV